jgi:hypothetical protein
LELGRLLWESSLLFMNSGYWRKWGSFLDKHIYKY